MHSYLIYLTVVSIMLSFQHGIVAAEASTGSDLVSKVCIEVPFKDLCISNLGSHPNSKQLDLAGLGSLALKIAMETAANTSVKIGELLEKSPDSFEGQCLSDCAENFLDATDQLEDSIAALDSKGYSDVGTWVHAAIADAESCARGFNEQPGSPSPLADISNIFHRQCRNALAINKLLSVA
ncbi:hypothetical protein Sjap_006876 [Stephania japonica]|uniref:Pectinesterase inhibitor domain-containing protein n=1 Tax=Stephania japonica TaxID=461633 RepID=A0AAP0K8F9_9MAGN